MNKSKETNDYESLINEVFENTKDIGFFKLLLIWIIFAVLFFVVSSLIVIIVSAIFSTILLLLIASIPIRVYNTMSKIFGN